MSQDRLRLVGTITTALLWAGVIAAAAIHAGDGTDLLAIVAGTATICVTLLAMRRHTERVFMHGYHAGFHDATKANCGYPDTCDVLVLSEERARRAN